MSQSRSPYPHGTNADRAVRMMLRGGKSRADISRKITETFPPTRSGVPVDGNKLLGNLIAELLEQGYTIESSWRLVPPTRSHARTRPRASINA